MLKGKQREKAVHQGDHLATDQQLGVRGGGSKKIGRTVVFMERLETDLAMRSRVEDNLERVLWLGDQGSDQPGGFVLFYPFVFHAIAKSNFVEILPHRSDQRIVRDTLAGDALHHLQLYEPSNQISSRVPGLPFSKTERASSVRVQNC